MSGSPAATDSEDPTDGGDTTTRLRFPAHRTGQGMETSLRIDIAVSAA
jgi:hypothetical protein